MFQEGDIYAHIQSRDVFLFHPYDSFTPVLDFIRRSSEDPGVIAIKQTLYRVGNASPIVKALIEARRSGKQVTAVVELKARFDEERNITWAEEMEKAGVNVVYGLVGMKIHAKLCLVVRREPEGVSRYVHIGTGNYNPSTAKMYTDMGLITANPNICADVTDLFNVMTGYAHREQYRELLVSPLSMRRSLLDMIQRETALHQQNGNGEIIFKCNQLVDKHVIRALYRASMEGVRVRLQVRGICCLRPGVKGISDNIEVTSIVGRFLSTPASTGSTPMGKAASISAAPTSCPVTLIGALKCLSLSSIPDCGRACATIFWKHTSATISRRGDFRKTAPIAASSPAREKNPSTHRKS